MTIPLPIGTDIMERARSLGIEEQVEQAIRQRVVAGVMEKLAKMLSEAGDMLKKAVEAELIGDMALFDVKNIPIEGVCTLGVRGHVSTSFDKGKLTEVLLGAGVPVETIEIALAEANKQSRKDIVGLTWAKKKKGE